MQVQELMTRHVRFTRPDATLRETAQRMRQFEVGAMPVIDNKKVIGFVTDRDLAIRGLGEGLPEASPIVDVMTPLPFTVYEDEDVDAAAKRMCEHKIRRLVVMDHQEQPAGILTIGDLAVQNEDEAGEVMHDVCESGGPGKTLACELKEDED